MKKLVTLLCLFGFVVGTVGLVGCDKKADDAAATGTEGGDDKPAEGGDDKPAEGGDDKPAEGGDDKPAEGGDDKPAEGGDE